MKKLYPFSFNPIPKERVWGGHDLALRYNKPFDRDAVIGESWEVSGFEDESSIISNGFLEKSSLYDVIETYMDEIVGDDHYKRFGNEFPLLVKLLDIQDRLSIQVHPDDQTAFDRHNSYGKSEAWYVLEASPDAKIYMGFNRDVDPSEFYQRCKSGTLEEVLNVFTPHKGDFYYIESGIIHSAGGGLVMAEVQQLSDVTYRIYDWGRENNPQTAREMHLELAFDCINYSKYDSSRYFVPAEEHHHDDNCQDHCIKKLTSNEHFTITSISLCSPLHIYLDKFESFILYFCSEGQVAITLNHTSSSPQKYDLSKGEWMLIPASLDDFLLSPVQKDTHILEVYIEKPEEEKDNYINDQATECHCHEHHH